MDARARSCGTLHDPVVTRRRVWSEERLEASTQQTWPSLTTPYAMDGYRRADSPRRFRTRFRLLSRNVRAGREHASPAGKPTEIALGAFGLLAHEPTTERVYVSTSCLNAGEALIDAMSWDSFQEEGSLHETIAAVLRYLDYP